MKKMFCTAAGRFERRANGCGRSYPVIILGGKEYMVDLQEMVLWTALNWRIVRREEIPELYEKTCMGSDIVFDRPLDTCIERLLVRGLLVSGIGDTDYDAIYDLLSAMYIIPADGSFFLRLASFLKLTVFNHVPLAAAKRLFSRDRRTDRESQVMHLARQALLSTAEIIKCVEKDIRYLPNEDSIMDQLYDDWETTSDNISYLVKSAPCSKAVTLAVANLYLRQQIILERM